MNTTNSPRYPPQGRPNASFTALTPGTAFNIPTNSASTRTELLPFKSSIPAADALLRTSGVAEVPAVGLGSVASQGVG